MQYTVTTRKKLPRNQYGDVYINTETAIYASGGSGGSSGGGGGNISVFTPATSEANGNAGLVPAPQIGSQLTNSYLLNAKGNFVSFELLEKLVYADSSARPAENGTLKLGTSSYIFSTAYIARWQPTSDSSKYIEYDSSNGAFKVNGSIYATGNVAAGGFSNTSGSGTGGGSDIDVYTASSLSSSFSNSSTSNTFNAYTISYLHRRISTLESGNINVDMSAYVKKTELSSLGYVTSTSLGSTLSSYVTKTQLSNQSYVTSTQLSNQSYVTSTQLSNQSYVTSTQLSNQSYVTNSALGTTLSSYVKKTGDTMSGNLTMGSGTKLIFNSSPASYIQYDSSNGALMVYGNIYATGQVAAGGYSGNSGSGGGTTTDTNTWRGINVNGTSFKGTAISSGNVNFVAGNNVTLSTSGNNITISATGGSSSGSGNITINNGSAESGKYISALSASGSTITVTKATLPSGSTSGDYLPLSGGQVNGNIRLWNPNNQFGEQAKLNFGDSERVYLYEDTDDHLTIYAERGITLAYNSSKNGASIQIQGLDLSGSGSSSSESEWYNIRTERTKDTSGVWSLHTLIENFTNTPLASQLSGSYISGTKYRMCIMTFKKHKGTGRSWRIPMFSRYWDWTNLDNKAQTAEPGTNSSNHHAQAWLWKYTWWTVNGNDSIWFDNKHLVTSSSRPKLLYSSTTSSNRNCAIDDRVKSTTYPERKVVSYNKTTTTIGYRWSGNKNKKMKVGVAIFKYTGEGTFGWQRVSNISYVELFVNDRAEVYTNVIV